VHVVLAGGGTAGHIEPALAVADALRRLTPAIGITALGTARGLETRLVPARGYPLELLPAVPLPRRLSGDLLSVPWRLAGAVSAADRVLAATGTDVLLGFGGYVAVPGYLAARRRGVPIVVHEANARPGIANRLGARLTHHVAAATPNCPLRHAQHVGIPLRTAIATLDRAARRNEAAAAFGLDARRPTLLVTGGSQGARRLNAAMVGAAPALIAAGMQVLHIAGPAQAVEVADALAGQVVGQPTGHPAGQPAGGMGPGKTDSGYVLLPYTDRMDLAYAAADLALCRAGAMTCAELAAVGLPVVFVPLPIGNGEQRLNAAPLIAAGGAMLVDDDALDAGWITDRVLPLLADSTRLTAMGRAMAALGRRDADVVLARMVLAAAGERRAA
jgi:UDP-N-acetylglucosamine--N-acetylmuramyl-(pentapeptide) pyrophosphoryl-undecaprenol N-acetylglucosamine transferase